MKILVFSDSHSGISFMRRCVDAVRPQAIVHLGDYYEDGRVIAEEYPGIPVCQVPGNCDGYYLAPGMQWTRIEELGGVKLYLTHGHRQRVKLGLGALIKDAKACGVGAVLFGHTHAALCERDESGMWILNPGSCGYFGGSAGVIETNNGKIVSCRIIRQENLEEML